MCVGPAFFFSFAVTMCIYMHPLRCKLDNVCIVTPTFEDSDFVWQISAFGRDFVNSFYPGHFENAIDFVMLSSTAI